MGKILILFIVTFSFGQINWQIEIVDSVDYSHGQLQDFRWCSMALDTNNIPHIIYQKANKLIHAARRDAGWQKEIVESGLLYGRFHFLFDKDGTAHLSYYRKDEALNMIYVCHAWKDTTGWVTEIVDSIYDVGNFWLPGPFYHISMDFDTLSQPAVAYITWSPKDSIYYIKYAHFNGASWDTSVVEYDSLYVNTSATFTDYNPSLKFSSKNVPIIAFSQLYYYQYIDYDTVKIAYFDDSLNSWVVTPAIYWPPIGQPSVSLQLDSRDRPCIALCRTATLAYAWWDGSSWQIQSVAGISIGTYGAVIDLALDSFDNPHIAFIGDALTPFPNYCYRDKDNIWHVYMPFEDSLYPRWGISLALSHNGEVSISYTCASFQSGVDIMALKYAKGTSVGIEEAESQKIKAENPKLKIHPNPFSKQTKIYFDIEQSAGHKGINTRSTLPLALSLRIYDATGCLVRSFNHLTDHHFNHITWLGDDDAGQQVPAGVYFISLETKEYRETKKILRLK